MSPRTVAFVGALCYLHPQLMPILAEHLEQQEGEVLPHVMMADVERWAEKNIHLNRIAVANLLEWMETQFQDSDSEIQELLAVSFLENFPQGDDKSAALIDMLGPGMVEEIQRLRQG